MRRPHYSLTFAVLALAGLVYTVLTSLVAPALRSLAGAAAAAAAFVLMGLAHDRPYQIYLGTATGINAIFRSVGGAFGTTLTAVILAGSTAAAGLPRPSGFTLAFLVSAIGLGVAALVSLAVPRSHRHQRRERHQSPSRPAPDPTATSTRTPDGRT